jgi:para-nitrobenzyl esterase
VRVGVSFAQPLARSVGRLFARFLKLLPLTAPLIERLLAHTDSADRERITAAYPRYPNPAACVELAADCAFGAANRQIAEAHGRHASAYLYRFDYAHFTGSLSTRLWYMSVT